MMRVLLLHNRYRAEGGEERAVREQHELLRRRGHDVVLLERSSASLPRGRAAAALLSGGIDPAAVAAAARSLRAEIVHAHNLHPLFGWRALAAAREAGARTVMQLHNFRLFCAIAICFRDGAPCHECRGRNTLPGVRHTCRGSLPEAGVYALGLSRQQPGFFAHSDRFAVLSDAHGARLREFGLPADRTDTLPNFLPEDAFAPSPRSAEGQYALVAGRLVEEKGFDTAIRACRAAGVPLVVAGEGPDRSRLESLAGGAPVRFTGWVPPEALAELRAGAGAVLVPSRCEEACPYAVLEGLAAGVPVFVSDRGGLPELVSDPAPLPAEDPAAWGEALATLWGDAPRRRALGARLQADAARRFGEAAHHERLLALYAGALAGAGAADGGV